jgi:phosphoenolpyruvate carboxylase
MSTQHPDNVNSPFFTDTPEIGGEDEILEAYYAFSHLGCDEQMWDFEGKEVDSFVVKKLSTKYENFFKENRLGKDLFITLRVPNPKEEKAEAKILLETLESIPRSFDVTKLIYDDDIPPIFEVILPMADSSNSLNRIYKYYKDFVVGKQNLAFDNDGTTISQWIGDFYPKEINVIPLFEDMKHMLNAHKVVEEYLKDKKVEYQRVFLARSDPALNYGLVSAVFLNKIALQRLYNFSKESGISIYPISGVGSAPFRGNLNPLTVENVVKEYPYVHTFTIQSAFKYDYHPDLVMKAVDFLRNSSTDRPHKIDEGKALEIIDKYSKEYKNQVKYLAPIINRVSKNVPSRRRRKLHVGLFGYSRSVEDITLPRAIKFTASLYSIGIPPELLGLNALNKDDLDFVRSVYLNFDSDIRSALKFYNENSPFLPEGLKSYIKNERLNKYRDEKFIEISNNLNKLVSEDHNFANLDREILRLAQMRKFLG